MAFYLLHNYMDFIINLVYKLIIGKLTLFIKVINKAKIEKKTLGIE